MLTDKEIDLLVERLTRRIDKANSKILIEIGNCIKQIGDVTPSRAMQLAQVLKYGGNFEKIMNELAKITNLNVKDIYDIFDAVARENYAFAEQFYKYNNKNYIPYEENLELQAMVKGMANNAVENYLKYFSVSPTGLSTRVIGYDFIDLDGKRTFEGLKATYEKVIDEAVLNVSMGKEAFETAMGKTIKQIGGSGLKYVEYESSLHRRLDSAIRMNVNDTIGQLFNTLQQQFGEEFGADAVEISVHNNCAPDHIDIQGRQLDLVEYDKLQNHLPFKDLKGRKYEAKKRAISEYNCRHFIFSIVKGVSKPNYTDKQLEEITKKNNEKISFNGKEYTGYELTQLQRQIETDIRKWKDIQDMAKASGNDALVNTSKSKIKRFLNEYDNLCKRGKLEPYYERFRNR